MKLGKIESRKVRRILAIKLGHLGDVLLMTPALDILHRLYPGAEISVMVRHGTEPMLQNNPVVTRIITAAGIGRKPSLWRSLPYEWQFVRLLRQQCFDLVVDFSSSDRSAICAFLSGAPERVGYTSEGAGFWGKDRLYTHVCRRPWTLKHTVLKDVDLVRDYAISSGLAATDAEMEAGPLVLAISSDDSAWAKKQWQTLAPPSGPRILVHPTSRWLFKCWSDAKMAALIERLQSTCHATILLSCGPDPKEIEKAKAILLLCRSQIHARLGDLTLGQLAALAREADLLIGVDSAPIHMAAAVGTRVVAIFGPTDHEAWAPWGKGHQVVRRPCPCREKRQWTCDKAKGMSCLNELSVEEVFEAANRVVAELAKHHAWPPDLPGGINQ